MGEPVVLLADDSKTMQHLLQAYLVGRNYRFIVCDDGEQALAAALEHHPILIISDLKMPELTGVQLTEAVRASPPIADTPIIIVSSSNDRATRAEVLKAGASGFLSKPLDPAKLGYLVKSLLS